MTRQIHLPRTLLFLACSLWAGSAFAQEGATSPESPFAPTETSSPPPEQTSPAPTGQAPVMVPYEPAAPVVEDGPRFRFGVGFGGGGEFVDEFSAWLVGFDFRLGVQVNDMIGIYVQPHLSFGKGTSGSVSGSTGTFAIAAMVDITLSDLVFFGGGFGYGVVNNPNGPMLALRGGIYPAVGRSQEGPRRRGLSLSFDFRTHFTGVGPVVQVMGMVGYEAF